MILCIFYSFKINPWNIKYLRHVSSFVKFSPDLYFLLLTYNCLILVGHLLQVCFLLCLQLKSLKYSSNNMYTIINIIQQMDDYTIAWINNSRSILISVLLIHKNNEVKKKSSIVKRVGKCEYLHPKVQKDLTWSQQKFLKEERIIW